MADVLITEFTDPACPWAFSAEPYRLRLHWLYGDRIEWETRMVVLSESAEETVAFGFDTPQLKAGYEQLAREYGMPIDTTERARMAASLPACRAVVAARLHAPEAMRPLLRALRVRTMSGALLDAPETLDGAAADAGLDAAALRGWAEGEDVTAAIAEDKALARDPMPAARVLDHKLGGPAEERRYTCPSYEVTRQVDGLRMTAPGFQPVLTYEVLLANLLPDTARRAEPDGVEEVLEWAGFPLASKEVAVLCGLDVAAARQALSHVATEQPVGADGYWTLRS
jgi:predicted DsbA family dithiol-disulfide isomerase